MRVTLRNGHVTFLPAIAAVPPSNGQQATKAFPAIFEVTFDLVCDEEIEGRRISNQLSWKTALPDLARDAPYDSIETAAAELLPIQLRQLADALEQEVAATNGT